MITIDKSIAGDLSKAGSYEVEVNGKPVKIKNSKVSDKEIIIELDRVP